MRDTVVDKDTVLEILKENRVTHQNEYEEALEGYRKKAVSACEEALKDAQALEEDEVLSWHRYFEDLQAPQSHTEQYERAIQMLEFDERDSVTLTQQDFQRYIQDEWEWTPSFKESYLSNKLS